ncbi:MAG: tripartite tricarboxylate transporter TctB family protein [Rhizobiales bacterium]|nr:tripartite tricarboxylate transporter TctB family protein [Hyphomicrobiales bacterium]
MSETIRARLPDLAACAFLGLFGLIAVWLGTQYPMGTVNHMGAGYFPVATSALIVVLAVAAAWETILAPPQARSFAWRPMIFVTVAILAWVLLVDDFGLVPATFALILISGLAKTPFRPISLIASASFLCLAGYLVFVWGLRMPLTLFGR